LRQSVIAPPLPRRPRAGPVPTRTSPPSAPFHNHFCSAASSFLCPFPHLCLTVDFLRGCRMWGGRLRPFERGLGKRLLAASFVSRVARSGPEDVTQACRCGAGSCHDILLPTGRLLTVSLLLCCSAWMCLCFSSWVISCSRLSVASQDGGLRLGQGTVGWRPSGVG